MPPQAGSITIMADDEPAAQLLSCLRENLRQLRVEIAEPDGHHVRVTDHSGSVASLPDLLDEQLDQCGPAPGSPTGENTYASTPSSRPLRRCK